MDKCSGGFLLKKLVVNTGRQHIRVVNTSVLEKFLRTNLVFFFPNSQEKLLASICNIATISLANIYNIILSEVKQLSCTFQ